MGDLVELYSDWCLEFGKRRADLFYWQEVILAIWSVAKEKAGSALTGARGRFGR